MDFHKPFTSIFSAYTTSILKKLLQKNRQDEYKKNRFWSNLKHSLFVLYQKYNPWLRLAFYIWWSTPARDLNIT